MSGMIGRFLPFILVFMIITGGCAKKDEYLLGVVVPVGSQKVSEETPYLVSGVFQDSPAYRAGIRPDDIIVQIGGVELKGLRCDYIYKNLVLGKKGTDVSFLIDRNGEKMLITVRRGG